jgi:hypothetical protein
MCSSAFVCSSNIIYPLINNRIARILVELITTITIVPLAIRELVRLCKQVERQLSTFVVLVVNDHLDRNTFVQLACRIYRFVLTRCIRGDS